MTKAGEGPSGARPAELADPGRAEVEGLLDVAEALLTAADSTAAGKVLLDAVVGMYGAPRGLLLASADGRLPVLSSHGLLDTGRPLGPCRSPAVLRVLEQNATRLMRRLDPVSEPWLAQAMPAGADLLLVPVSADERKYGVLLLQLPSLAGSGWRSAVVGPLERAATCTAYALRTMWRMEHLERLAATDDLTMIANRRTFAAALEREIARGARSGEPVSLVILDIDRFKLVNDLHGHPAGDEALRNVAAALSIACRDLDTAARYGGEEFAVILPDCGPERSVDIADRLREAVASAPAIRALTASAGVASYPMHGGDADSLVRAADDALLVSKRTGRNRTSRATGVALDNPLRAAVAQRVLAQPKRLEALPAPPEQP